MHCPFEISNKKGKKSPASLQRHLYASPSQCVCVCLLQSVGGCLRGGKGAVDHRRRECLTQRR